jgi:hypothetical protein
MRLWTRGKASITMVGSGPFTHVYHWGNNAVRKFWQGKRCRVLVRGSLNSCLVEFEDGGQLNTSIRALRKIKSEEQMELNNVNTVIESMESKDAQEQSAK